jgi:hypothetical protein
MLTIPLGRDPFAFYDGETSLNEAVPFTVRLDGRTYGVDLRNYRRSSLATLRDSVVSTGQVDDSLFNTDGAWWRYRRNWNAGAGQSIMDLGESRDSRRFDTSVGVDVWTEGQLTLLPATTLSTALVDGSDIKLAVTATHIYALDNTVVYRSTNLSTWEQVTTTGTPKALTSDGVNVYIAGTTKVEKVTPASTTAVHFANKVVDDLWFAAGYLFGSEGSALHTFSSNGSDSKIYEHFLNTFVWTTVFAVGSKVYAGGYGGVRSEIYGFTISSSGTLVLGAEVAPFGINELVLEAVSHVGTVLICTNKGIRLSTVGADGTISYGPLIDDPGPVNSAFAEGRFYWFTWSGIAPNKTGVGRADISLTPNPLQPAYASDIYAEQSSSTTAVVRFAGRTVFAVANSGIYVESATAKVTSGRLTSGKVYYGSVETKSVTDALASFAPLAAGQKISMSVYDDSGNNIEDVVGNQVGQTTIDVQLDGEQGNYFEATVTLEGNGLTTPILRYWRLRAFPVVPPVEQFIVPLLVYSKTVINDGQGQLLSSNVDDEIDHLISAWKDKRPLTFIEGDSVKRVRLEAYEYAPNDWSDTHTNFEGTMTVRLVTL